MGGAPGTARTHLAGPCETLEMARTIGRYFYSFFYPINRAVRCLLSIKHSQSPTYRPPTHPHSYPRLSQLLPAVTPPRVTSQTLSVWPHGRRLGVVHRCVQPTRTRVRRAARPNTAAGGALHDPRQRKMLKSIFYRCVRVRDAYVTHRVVQLSAGGRFGGDDIDTIPVDPINAHPVYRKDDCAKEYKIGDELGRWVKPRGRGWWRSAPDTSHPTTTTPVPPLTNHPLTRAAGPSPW